MRRAIIPFILLSLAALASAEDAHSERVTVSLSNFHFDPKTVHLHAGQPTILHLVNDGGSGHDFSASQFFAAAMIEPASRNAIVGGAVDLDAHQTRDVALVPKAGHYPLKCTHSMHKMFGMSGEIVVD